MECCDNRNGCVKMCLKIKQLNGLTSSNLLKNAGQADIVPIDIAQICYDLKIILKPFNFTILERNDKYKKQVNKKGNILGAVLAKDDDLAILYRESDSKNRKRFTIAHELAHCCLHIKPEQKQYIEYRRDVISSDKREIEANIFAGELLIPENALRTVIGSRKVTSEVIDILSKIFVVSNNVMIERLKHLNIDIAGE